MHFFNGQYLHDSFTDDEPNRRLFKALLPNLLMRRTFLDAKKPVYSSPNENSGDFVL